MNPDPIHVFLVEASEDEALGAELKKHLATLRRDRINLWRMCDIQAGQDHASAVERHIDEAHLILILVSAGSLASDLCHGITTAALARQHEGDVRVIPVLAAACDWRPTLLGDLDPLPRNGLPVTSWPNHAEAWDDVVRGIRLELDCHRGSGVVDTMAQPAGRTNDGSVVGACLPPSNLPPRRVFVGREDAIRAIDEVLAEPDCATISQVSVSGLGGIGKTALALEYAYRHRSRYPGGIWWLSAEGPPIEAMGRLASTLRVHAAEPVRGALGALRPDTCAEDVARAIREALQNHDEPTLLVLDNVSATGFRDLIPAGRAKVLITTQDARFALGRAVPLGVLLRSDAIALAQGIAGKPASPAEAEALERVILEELGSLPIGVELAARAVEQWLGSWLAYERQLREGMERLLDDSDLYRDYDRGVFAALDMSIQRCSAETPEQKLLWSVAAFAPEPVAVAWAALVAGLDPEDLVAAKALAALRNLGLVTIDVERQIMAMHRLVHRRVRARAELERAEEWRAVRRDSVELVTRWLEIMLNPTRMAEIDRHRAHIDEALGAAAQAGDDRSWVDLANILGRHLQNRAAFAEAQSLFEEGLRKAEALEPADPRLIAGTVSNLGALFWASGRSVEALPHFQRSLSMSEALYPATHPELARNLGNLGLVLRNLGRPVEALAMLDRAAEVAEKVFDPRHPLLAIALSNRTGILLELDRHDEVPPIVLRALEIAERALGPEHPEVARCLSLLAMAVHSSGNTPEACKMLERALSIYEHCYGPEHPLVAQALSNRATILIELNSGPDDQSIARQLMERAVAIYERCYGSDHPALGRSLSNLAIVQLRSGDAVEARALLERGVTIVENAHGKSHPDVALLCSNLAEEMSRQGEWQEAGRLLKRAIAVTESIYGPDHSSMAVHLSKLATVYEGLERSRDAVEALERVLAIIQGSCGPEDAKLFGTVAALGRLHDQLGDPEKARPYLERALAIAERAHELNHPAVAAQHANLAFALLGLDLFEDARKHLEVALDIVERDPGPLHPTTTTIRWHLLATLRQLDLPDAALPLVERTIAASRTILGDDHPEVAEYLREQAILLIRLRRPAEAQRRFRAPLAGCRLAPTFAESVGTDSPSSVQNTKRAHTSPFPPRPLLLA